MRGGTVDTGDSPPHNMSVYLNAKVYGPYQRKDGREHVVLVFPDGSKRTVSYPKYLIETRTGRKLLPSETVHHKDKDPLNNAPKNLEILSRKKHCQQDAKRVRRKRIICVWCGVSALKQARYLNGNSQKKRAGPFCSKKCSGTYGAQLQHGQSDELEVQPEVPVSERRYFRHS